MFAKKYVASIGSWLIVCEGMNALSHSRDCEIFVSAPVKDVPVLSQLAMPCHDTLMQARTVYQIHAVLVSNCNVKYEQPRGGYVMPGLASYSPAHNSFSLHHKLLGSSRQIKVMARQACVLERMNSNE